MSKNTLKLDVTELPDGYRITEWTAKDKYSKSNGCIITAPEVSMDDINRVVLGECAGDDVLPGFDQDRAWKIAGTVLVSFVVIVISLAVFVDPAFLLCLLLAIFGAFLGSEIIDDTDRNANRKERQKRIKAMEGIPYFFLSKEDDSFICKTGINLAVFLNSKISARNDKLDEKSVNKLTKYLVLADEFGVPTKKLKEVLEPLYQSLSQEDEVPTMLETYRATIDVIIALCNKQNDENERREMESKNRVKNLRAEMLEKYGVTDYYIEGASQY